MNTVFASTDDHAVRFESKADSFLTNVHAAVSKLNGLGANVTAGDMGKTWRISVV